MRVLEKILVIKTNFIVEVGEGERSTIGRAVTSQFTISFLSQEEQSECLTLRCPSWSRSLCEKKRGVPHFLPTVDSLKTAPR